MLDQTTRLPDLEEALAGTEFEEATDCLKRTFESNRVTTVYDLDNSPRIFTCCVCGVNTHNLIIHIREYLEDAGGDEPEAVAVGLEEALETLAGQDEEE